jgi:Holliday junction DNA helicase RuvB
VREELGVGIRSVAGPALERKGDMAAILTSLEERDVLFVDEIHRLNRAVEEILYPALEDYRLDIIVGQGPAARTLTPRPPALHARGATTRTGFLTTPLRDRFGMTYRLDYYGAEDLAASFAVRADPRCGDRGRGGEENLTSRRGTPRVANRILRRVRDVAQVRHDGAVTLAIAQEALALLELTAGLERIDRELCGRSSRSSTAALSDSRRSQVSLGEETDTIEDVYEPYLLQLGLIQRTPRGRVVTKLGRAHVGAAAKAESSLF